MVVFAGMVTQIRIISSVFKMNWNWKESNKEANRWSATDQNKENDNERT